MADDHASIGEHFANIDDPRNHNIRHKLIDIITIAICAIISGAETATHIEEFGKSKINWFKQFLELPNAIPSHDTFGRVFAMIDPQQFRHCFRNWVQTMFELSQGTLVAIDGKTLRRSYDSAENKSAIHMVSAWCCKNALVLGQIKTNEKSNEITAIPELIKTLELKGTTVSIDAMGC